MPRCSLAPAWLLLSLVITVFVACSVTPAQTMGPEMYGLVGRFGMGTPVPTRVLAMGGFLSCVNDDQFANPAFAAVQTRPSMGVRATRTEFDNGPTVDSYYAHLTLPLLPRRSGLQFTVITLDSSGDPAVLPGVGPVEVNMSESAMVVDYGRRLRGHLTGGLSVLGFEDVGLTFTSGFGAELADVDDTAQYGFRGGLAYEWAPGDFIGAMYSFSRDDVDFRALVQSPGGGAPVQVAQSLEFDSSQFVLGASRHLNPNLLLAAEYQHGVLSGDGSDKVSDTWSFGAEYLVAPDWGLRAGVNDGDFCCGVGWDGPHWRADYAFINGWSSGDVSPLFGGSATHSFEVMYRW
ncbi:hypothetical protein LLH23_14340 [bacterium]|nr:hypothetical protein [bacterium]